MPILNTIAIVFLRKPFISLDFVSFQVIQFDKISNYMLLHDCVWITCYFKRDLSRIAVSPHVYLLISFVHGILSTTPDTILYVLLLVESL